MFITMTGFTHAFAFLEKFIWGLTKKGFAALVCTGAIFHLCVMFSLLKENTVFLLF